MAATLAIILAACEAATPSGTPPTDLPDVTPAPMPTISSLATPRPDSCPLVATSVAELSVEFMGPISRQEAEFHTESITRLGGGGNVYEDASDPGAWEAGWLIGGQELTLKFEPRPRLAAPGAWITEITAIYHRPGNSAWAPIAMQPLINGGIVTIPDGSGPGQLRVSGTWSDGCFTYAGSVRFAFEVIPAAVAAACPSDAEGLGEILRAHQDDQILIGGVARSIGTLSHEARYVPYSAADQVGPFSSWDPAAEGVDASADELLEAKDDDPDLRLSGGIARFYLRTDPNSTSTDGLVESSATALEADASGRLLIVSPTTAGSYVLELSTSWELECLTGGGLAYFSVEVGSPVGGLPRASV